MTLQLTRSLALALSVASLALPAASAHAAKPLRWILNGPAISTWTTDPTAISFFAHTRPFVVAPKWRNAAIPPSWSAVRTRIFTSYAEFRRAVSNGRIDREIKAVLYDNEGWNLTPEAEQDNFAQYAQQFYNLARRHGYLVIQTPALSLATRLQPPGERRFDTFVRLGFPANAARYADAIDIQVQGSQSPPQTYAQFVSAAAEQARKANPRVLVFAGISTNPAGHKASAEQIVRAIEATHNVVDGYWFNVPQRGPSCPHCNDFRPDMALEVLRTLRTRGY